MAIDLAIKTKQAIPAAQLAQGPVGPGHRGRSGAAEQQRAAQATRNRFYLVDYGVSLRASVQDAHGTDRYEIQRISIP
ncbi:MAG: hypothetical protein H7138_20475 [Myxococcales bacterium]|nr:hypothetical protein [Myxococcales bacterium]